MTISLINIKLIRMPIFLKNNILFIHIPKNGGTSIENFMLRNCDRMDLWMRSNKKDFCFFHSEQHCTYKELIKTKKLKPELKIFSVIRHPVNRVISEYNWLDKTKKGRYNNFDVFLDNFLNKNNFITFDNHNLSNFDYLSNDDDEICEDIKIFKFFDKDGISDFIGLNKKIDLHANVSQKKITEITTEQKERILDFYKDDLHCFDFDMNSPIIIKNKNLKNL